MNNLFIITIIILLILLNIFKFKNKKISEKFITSRELKDQICTDKGDYDPIDHLDHYFDIEKTQTPNRKQMCTNTAEAH